MLQQGLENIERVAQNKPTTSNPSVNSLKVSPTTRFDINTTMKILDGKTNWEQILRQDLALSDDDSPQLISRSTLTDQTQHPDSSRSCNTSPIDILDMKNGNKTFLTTHEAPQDIKEFLKISKKPTSQIGCIPLVAMKNRESQTENSKCKDCSYEEHLILQWQAYIIKDAIRNTDPNYSEPSTSREDRHKMPLPNKSAHMKWIAKFRRETIPQSPTDFKKARITPTFTRPEIKISSSQAPVPNPKLKRPSALTVDNETYEAICSRKATRPTLVTSPRVIKLPPP